MSTLPTILPRNVKVKKCNLCLHSEDCNRVKHLLVYKHFAISLLMLNNHSVMKVTKCQICTI